MTDRPIANVFIISTERAARPLEFGVKRKHPSAFEEDLPQQYRTAWGEIIGAELWFAYSSQVAQFYMKSQR